MSGSADDRTQLISPTSKTDRYYGATTGIERDDAESATSDGTLTPINGDVEGGSGKLVESVRETKKFKDIWVLCLGLFSA